MTKSETRIKSKIRRGGPEARMSKIPARRWKNVETKTVNPGCAAFVSDFYIRISFEDSSF